MQFIVTGVLGGLISFTERPSGHTEEFFLERRIFLLCCQCEALAAKGPPVDCRPGRGRRGAGPLRDPGCRAGARGSSQSWSFHTWVSIPAFQQARTGSAAPAASNRRGALLSQGIWVCKLQKDLLQLSLPLEWELNYLLLQSFPHLSHC